MLRYLIVAGVALAAAPADALCVPTADFHEVLARWGEAVRYAGISTRNDAPIVIYIAVGDDGAWTAFFVEDGVDAVCLLATGTDWKERATVEPAAPDAGGEG